MLLFPRYLFIPSHFDCCLFQAQSDDKGLEEEDDSSSKDEKKDEVGKDKTEVF